jgi:hypothetical protein
LHELGILLSFYPAAHVIWGPETSAMPSARAVSCKKKRWFLSKIPSTTMKKITWKEQTAYDHMNQIRSSKK